MYYREKNFAAKAFCYYNCSDFFLMNDALGLHGGSLMFYNYPETLKLSQNDFQYFYEN